MTEPSEPVRIMFAVTHAGVSRQDYDEAHRWTETTMTWFAKVAARLVWVYGRSSGDARWAVGYFASRLLESVLRDAPPLVELLDDEQVEQALERSEALTQRLRDLRLAAKLENVAGRTPEEAAEFLAKAARLRAGRG